MANGVEEATTLDLFVCRCILQDIHILIYTGWGISSDSQ